jgi:hypothetical protein
VLVFSAAASVGNQHLKLHIVNETLADLFQNSFHSANEWIVVLPQLKDSHAMASCGWQAIALARMRSNFSANSFETRFC